jgi:hypothetical protein
VTSLQLAAGNLVDDHIRRGLSRVILQTAATQVFNIGRPPRFDSRAATSYDGGTMVTEAGILTPACRTAGEV